LQQFFNALCAFVVAQARKGNVFAGVGLDELLHQPIDRTANCRDQVQRLGAIGITLQRFLDRLHLPGYPPYAVEQFVFVLVNVRHTYTPYPYMARMIIDGFDNGKTGQVFRVGSGFVNNSPPVGAGLPAKAAYLTAELLDVPATSRASPLPQVFVVSKSYGFGAGGRKNAASFRHHRAGYSALRLCLQLRQNPPACAV
jgi:hypothetical protein